MKNDQFHNTLYPGQYYVILHEHRRIIMTINKSGRPDSGANIYKNGRLKNKQELKKERERIVHLSFDDLLSECAPITQEKLDYLKELVNGVDIDLDEPLDKQIDATQSFETMNPIDFDYIITTLQEKLVISKISLDKLAKLGNGEHYGNSDGNVIAQEAISKLNE